MRISVDTDAVAESLTFHLALSNSYPTQMYVNDPRIHRYYCIESMIKVNSLYFTRLDRSASLGSPEERIPTVL
jgi:hypothetical protein